MLPLRCQAAHGLRRICQGTLEWHDHLLQENTKYSVTPWTFSEAHKKAGAASAVLVYLYRTRRRLGRSERGARYLLPCSILSRRPHSSEMYVPWLHRSFQATHTAVAGQREKQATTLRSLLWVRRNRGLFCECGVRLRVYPMCLAPLFFLRARDHEAAHNDEFTVLPLLAPSRRCL